MNDWWTGIINKAQRNKANSGLSIFQAEYFKFVSKLAHLHLMFIPLHIPVTPQGNIYYVYNNMQNKMMKLAKESESY